MANHISESSRPRMRQVLKWVACLVVLCCIGVGLTIWQGERAAAPKASPQPSGVVASPSGLATPSSSAEPVAVPAVEKPTTTSIESVIPLKSEPLRLDIPDANISVSVSLHPLTDNERSARYLRPPNDPNGYWTDLFDQPGRDATDLTYISGHGCEGLPICHEIDWPFNRLSDPTLVKKGTGVFVSTKNGKVCYSVDRDTATYEKGDLKNQGEIFGEVEQPQRLILVSCYTGAIHDRNVVAVATRVACA